MDTPVSPQTIEPAPAEVAAPDPVQAALLRAEQASRQKNLHEAAGICRDVLDRAPNHPTATAMLGALLGQLGDVAEGIRLLQQACAAQGNQANWHNNLCSLYRMDCQLDAALEAGRMAVRLAPGNAGIVLNLGKVHMDRGESDPALLCFFTVLGQRPDDAEAHLAIGQMLLARGEFRPGWVEYDWRNKLEQARGMIPTMASPVWNGMALPQGRVLLICDQGYGDSLQFCRYIPKVAALCKEVVVGASADLEGLVAGIPGVTSVHTRWQDIPRHTCHALMSSLPGILGTEEDSIPAAIPYLSAPDEAVAAWRALLDARLPQRRPRIGFTWAGRPTHPNDSRRSLGLEQLAPLLDLPGYDAVSVQKVVPARDAAAYAARQGRMLDLAAQMNDFAATAALLAQLDLVITVDSSVAHLAGALGRPVWVLCPDPADWRWLLDRTDSPWYPTLRLFRQPRPGDWDGAIAAAALALAEALPTLAR